MKTWKSILCTVGLFSNCLAAFADTDQSVRWSFDGFGTLGLVYTNERHADFVGNLFARRGAGHSGRISPEVDSRVGFQVTGEFTPALTGIVQVVSEQNYDGTYTPRLEWANLKYAFTPEFDMRIGRMVSPAFMVSEYRKVGYANPWVRPPQEVYRLLPVTNFDGIDFNHRVRFDDMTATVRGGYGWTDADTEEGVIKSRNAFFLVAILESRESTLFSRYSRTALTIDAFDPLFDGFRMFGPAGEAIADRYAVDNTKTNIWSLGLRHEPRDWFVMAEWSRARTRSVLGDSEGWYISSGYRHGSLTPYVTLAGRRPLTSTSHPGVPVAGLPPQLAGKAAMLNSTLNQILGMAPRQKSVSLGLRWDVVPGIALKGQFDYLDLASDSPGVLGNIQPEFERGGSVSLFSLSMDFVF